MSILSEFREFAMKGNVVDLAIGVIMGAAFAPIVATLTDNIIMPPIGYLLGGVDFKNFAVTMPVPKGDPVLIKYGVFLQAIVDFVIIAFVLFLVIKAMNRIKKKAAEAPAAPPPTPEDIALLREIRDLLKKP